MWAAGTIALFGCVVLGYWAGRARAAIPTSDALTYSGVLTDTAGAPINGSRNLQLQAWDKATDGTLKCSVGPTMATLSGGAFQIPLPAACVTAVQASGDIWIELIVNGESLGRSKLGAVPYALEAGHALRASAADTSTPPVMIRVADTRTGCPPTAPKDTDLLTVAIPLGKSSSVRIAGDIIRNVAGRADLALIVDGQVVTRALTYTPTAQWAPAHVEWVGTLAAGNHSASLRGVDLADIWGCGTDWGAISATVYQ
jgi:hypothetical protein